MDGRVMKYWLLLTAALSLPVPTAGQRTPYFRAPALTEQAVVVPGGRTILPNGRYLTPKGQRLYTGDNLWRVIVRPDGKALVGIYDDALAVYALPHRPDHGARVIPVRGVAPSAVFTRDSRRLIVAGGEQGGVLVFDATEWDRPVQRGEAGPLVVAEQQPTVEITANDDSLNSTYINAIAVRSDERVVFGVDTAHQRLVTFDLVERETLAAVPAGRQPYALALSDDGGSVYVANIGLFNYALVGPPDPGQGNPRGLSKPPFGFPSREAEVGKRMEGRNVPGLGSPYVPDGQSVWKYDVSDPRNPKRVAAAKAGILIHAPADGGKAVGGSAPNELLIRGNRLYVSNANNDTVQVFDAASLKSVATIRLTPSPLVRRLRGVIPSGMAMSRDGKRLYVCESGLNAVAVIDTTKRTVIGHIPTGWFPTHVAVTPDGRSLAIATQKGIGRGPRGAKHRRTPGDERYGLSDMPGMIDLTPAPSAATLARHSREVLANNGIADRTSELARLPKAPISRVHGKPSDQIKYVVFITKENHTFDGIYGDFPDAKGDPDYAEFGMRGWIRENGKTERIPIMPNQHKLAREFAISDCFYMEPQASGDGHRWLVGVYPSLWTTRVFYAGWNYAPRNDAPGRLVSFGSDGSQIPEDYLENGSLWEHLERGSISFRNYGEGYEMPRTDEGPMTNRTGTYYQANYPMPKVLYDNSCFDFPAYNTNIPDIARADWFKEDLEKYRKANGGRIPRFLNIAICNDHGAGPRPSEGYPYVCSYMADNDLALGRIVEYLTHLPEWKNMAIFVTQDDPGGDDDHVDRHRSYVLCISPYAKRGYVSHVHGSIMSIIKTIYLIFGLGPSNMFDALATDLSDMMTMKPDFTPYQHVGADRRVFREEETFDPFDPDFKKRRERPSEVRLDDPRFFEWLRNRGEEGER